MSSYDDAARSLETEKQQEEGAYLSQEEREQVRRMLKYPEEFPRELGAWVEDYVGTNANIQKSQVQGLPLLFTQVQEQVEALAVIGTTYADDEAGAEDVSNGTVTTQPVVSVPAGTYFCILVAQAQILSGLGSVSMRLYNGSTSAAFGSIGYWEEVTAVPGPIGTILSIGSVTVTGASNDIKAYHERSGAGTRRMSNRFLIALRTG